MFILDLEILKNSVQIEQLSESPVSVTGTLLYSLDTCPKTVIKLITSIAPPLIPIGPQLCNKLSRTLRELNHTLNYFLVSSHTHFI